MNLLGALDYKTGKQILKLLQDTARKEKMTVLIITHNTAIAPMADKVIYFKNGAAEKIEINQTPQLVETIEWQKKGEQMKKALIKDSIKEIKNTYKRFISITLMAFLGVGFFAGIRATSPDMVDTIDKYYDTQNVYDVQVVSTLGLTDNDIEELKKRENVEEVIGTFEKDGKIEIDDNEIITKIVTIEDLNKPVLLERKTTRKRNRMFSRKQFFEN